MQAREELDRIRARRWVEDMEGREGRAKGKRVANCEKRGLLGSTKSERSLKRVKSLKSLNSLASTCAHGIACPSD